MNNRSEKTIFETSNFSDADVKKVLETRLARKNAKFYSSAEAKKILGVKVAA